MEEGSRRSLPNKCREKSSSRPEQEDVKERNFYGRITGSVIVRVYILGYVSGNTSMTIYLSIIRDQRAGFFIYFIFLIRDEACLLHMTYLLSNKSTGMDSAPPGSWMISKAFVWERANIISVNATHRWIPFWRAQWWIFLWFSPTHCPTQHQQPN